MGVPQGVLFSETVREGLLEEYDLQMISLGSFDYKNVDGSMEVFALANNGFALPRRVDLTGKFKNDPVASSKTIAVLPFDNIIQEPEHKNLGEGIAEETIYALSRLNQLKVVSRISSFAFKGKNVGAYEIGKQLKVVNVLAGSVKKHGDRIRVSAELINVSSGFQLWTEQFEGSLDDSFGMQEEIARALARKLESSLLRGEVGKSLINQQTASVEAYQLYLKGRQLLDQRTDFNLALQYYNEALSYDPKYALAYSAMAYIYFYQVLFDFKPPTFFLKAQEASHKAIQLNPNLAEAYIIDGIVYFYYYWNPKKALEQYKIAFSLDPNYDIHRIMAYYYSMIGNTEEALRLARRAVELEPLNHGASLGLGEILYRSSRFGEAIEILESLYEKIPNNKIVHSLLGSSYYQIGDVYKTMEFMDDSDFEESLTLFYSLPKFNYHIDKKQVDAACVLLKLVENSPPDRWISPLCQAVLHFGFDDLERAKKLLHQALTVRDPILWIINSEPTWEAFRSHPEMKIILADRFVHR